MSKLHYWLRIFKVYLTKTPSYLNFWHEEPAINSDFKKDRLAEYYMTFEDKAKYAGPKDKKGVILFDYYGNIGRQYNPVAIAQYGLGHYNLYLKRGNKKNLEIAREQADWLVENLEVNQKGLMVWQHHFDWTYKKLLKAPWYSALAQGAGISLLLRIHLATKEEKYLKTAKEAFEAMTVEMTDGGVKFFDENKNIWLEEYIIFPPTHILNGFIWALWGVWDYYLVTRKRAARDLFDACVETLKKNINKYDTGFWSLYDLSKQFLKMLASPFYHKLHIVQLEVMSELTSEAIFNFYARKWREYQNNKFYQYLALVYKAIFKLIYF